MDAPDIPSLSPPAGLVRRLGGDMANLDTLRSFAVLVVLFDHIMLTLNGLYFQSEFIQHFVMRLGRLGVVAFFVHTSLVLMFSLERVHRESSQPALAFYLRRIFRIYPLSILVVIFVCIYQIPDLPFGTNLPGRYSPLNIGLNLLLMHNFIGFPVSGPLWSLPFEIQMYMVLPVLYLWARRDDGARRLLGLIGLSSVVAVTVYLLTGKLHFLAFIPCFLSGVLAYSVRHRVQPRFSPVGWNFLVPLMLGLCALAGALWPKQEYLAGWALAFFLGGTVYMFHDSVSKPWNSITKNIAKYSYGIYLFHVPAIWFVFKILGITHILLAPALVVLITGATSVFFFHLIEDPMIQYGKRVTRRLVPSAPRPAPAMFAEPPVCEGPLKARSASASS